MGKVRVSAFSVSLDGFAAGPGQDLQHPFGLGADEVPAWLRKTKMFHDMIGQPGGAGADKVTVEQVPFLVELLQQAKAKVEDDRYQRRNG